MATFGDKACVPLPNQDCHGDSNSRCVSSSPPSSLRQVRCDDRLSFFRRRQLPGEATRRARGRRRVITGYSSGWSGLGDSMLVGSDYTSRELCDGQTLDSPGRWPEGQRRYPRDAAWLEGSSRFMEVAKRHSSPELLTSNCECINPLDDTRDACWISLISLTMNACNFDSQNPVAKWSRALSRCDMSLNTVKTRGMRAQAGVKQTSTTEQLKREDHACKLKQGPKTDAVLATAQNTGCLRIDSHPLDT